jgi:hypothetical protein
MTAVSIFTISMTTLTIKILDKTNNQHNKTEHKDNQHNAIQHFTAELYNLAPSS